MLMIVRRKAPQPKQRSSGITDEERLSGPVIK
jgi:hypothetical protein